MPFSTRFPLILMVVLISACGPALRAETEEERSYPAYSPGEASLFDDSISESAISGVSWVPDTKFRDRVQRADTVTAARIMTITEAPAEAGAPRFLVEVRAFGTQLAGRPETQPIRLELKPDNPAYGRFRWQRRQLLGRDFVLLYRRYAEGGLVVVHFRAEPHTPQVHYAVSNARQGF